MSRAPGTRESWDVMVASRECLRLCKTLEAFSFDLNRHARRLRLISFTNGETEETDWRRGLPAYRQTVKAKVRLELTSADAKPDVFATKRELVSGIFTFAPSHVVTPRVTHPFRVFLPIDSFRLAYVLINISN